MKQKINISIPEPCHENWQAMTWTEKGKFCSSCQNNVFDFTTASDRQIIEAYNKDPKLCGRFLNTQLNRDLIAPKEKNSVRLATTSAIISFLTLGNQETVAQETAKTEQTDKKVISDNSNQETSNQEKNISGIVSDSIGPMPGVNVIIKRTQQGTQTDLDGKFNIKVKEGETLVFSFLGMIDKPIIVDKSNFYQIKLIEDKKSIDKMFITAGGIARKKNKIPNHNQNSCIEKRSFFGRLFHKIDHLFN